MSAVPDPKVLRRLTPPEHLFAIPSSERHVDAAPLEHGHRDFVFNVLAPAAMAHSRGMLSDLNNLDSEAHPIQDIISRVLDDQLLGWLTDTIGRMYFVEYEIFKRIAHLKQHEDKTAEQLYVSAATDFSYLNYLRHKYPVYATQTDLRIERISNLVSTVYNSYHAQSQHINHALQIADSATIMRIEPTGDPHDQGLRTCVLTLGINSSNTDSFTRVVYKPRDSEGEKLAARISAYFHQHGLELLVPRYFHDGKALWQEYVDEQSPSSNLTTLTDKQATDLGHWLAVAYYSASTDFHVENFVYTSYGVVPVDFECLASGEPVPFDQKRTNLQGQMEAIEQCGILPYTLETANGDQGANWSAYYGSIEDDSGVLAPVVNFEQGKNSVNTEASATNPAARFISVQGAIQHLPLLLESFRAASNVIRTDSDGWMALFENSEHHPRIVIRPTMHYGLMLSHIFHPKFLSSQTDFDNELQSMLEDTNPTRCADFARMEFDYLRHGLIPKFEEPDFSSVREQVGETYFWAEELIRHRLNSLLNGDGQFVTEKRVTNSVISYAAKYLTDGRLSAGSPDLFSLSSRNSVYGRDSYADAAHVPSEPSNKPSFGSSGFAEMSQTTRHKIVDSFICLRNTILDEMCEYRDGSMYWHNVLHRGDDRWRSVPTDDSSYHGALGMFWTLCASYEVTSDAESYALLDRYWNRTIKPLIEDMVLRANSGLGVYHGLGAALISLEYAYRLEVDQQVRDLYCRILDETESRIETGQVEFDLVSGVSGLLAALCSTDQLRANFPELARSVADSCARLLRTSSQFIDDNLVWFPHGSDQWLGGLSHGVGGVATALNRALTQSLIGDEYFDLADRASISQLSLLNECKLEWLDLRPEYREHNGSPMNAWCHGRDGLLVFLDSLTELLSHTSWTSASDGLNLAKVSRLVSAFESIIASDVISDSTNLCHGLSGRIVLMSSRAGVDAASVETLTNRLFREWEYINAPGNFSLRSYDASFMLGRSGELFALANLIGPISFDPLNIRFST